MHEFVVGKHVYNFSILQQHAIIYQLPSADLPPGLGMLGCLDVCLLGWLDGSLTGCVAVWLNGSPMALQPREKDPRRTEVYQSGSDQGHFPDTNEPTN